MPIESFEKFTPRVHERAFVHPMATLIGDVEVGEEASIWPSAVLRADHGKIQIGARTSIQDGTVVHVTEGLSTTRIGDHTTVGHRVVLHGCKVGNHCLVGMGSVLLDNAELGDFCLLGAGSLVTQNKIFPPKSFLLGSPAKRVREVTAQELEWIEYSWLAYQDLAHRYSKK
ncbi:MAG: gamma carbonic anhydrase family protein [Myxococcaceae bacterium]